jgi:thiosulfate dehydrogenase [quinone] large subunit
MARTVVLDQQSGTTVSRWAADVAAVLRIGLGLLYLWAFVAGAFGIEYANSTTSATGVTSYGWHFAYDSHAGWITSGFKTSPTAGFVSTLHGPLAFIPQKLPTGLDDFLWIFALAGLGIGLTLGIFMYLAGWGGFALNVLLWFSLFPPVNNPVIDGEHMAFGVGILLLMLLHAGNRWGLGRWWCRITATWLH